MTSKWSNSFTLTFLECYQSEPCIWNPLNADHRDKSKVADAWTRISQLLGKPVKELKSKKESLMGTFRKHFKKKRDSIRSGSGVDDVYQPIWFAYETMESFLSPVFTTKTSLNSEAPQSMSPEADIDDIFYEGDTDNENSMAFASNYESSLRSQSTQKRMGKSRHQAASDLPEQQMATAFKELTNVLSQRQLQDKEDECDLYGKLLAKKLRELPTDDRRMIMYDIDDLFVRRIRKRSISSSSSPSQYCGYSTPQSGPNRYVIVQKKPKPSNISVLSGEVILPARQNIIDEALLNACKDD